MGLTGLLGAQWPRSCQCLFSEGQGRVPATSVMSAPSVTSRNLAAGPCGSPGRGHVGWAPGQLPGQRQCHPRWHVPPPQDKSRAQAALSVPPPQPPGQMPHGSSREGQEAGHDMAACGKWVFRWGSPHHTLTSLPPPPRPQAPLGSSLRNRKISADGKALETVRSVLSPVPGDVGSFPHSHPNRRRALRGRVCPGAEGVLRIYLGISHASLSVSACGGVPSPQIWPQVSPIIFCT